MIVLSGKDSEVSKKSFFRIWQTQKAHIDEFFGYFYFNTIS